MEEQHHSYVIKTVEEIGRGGFGYVEKVEIYNINGIKCGDYAKKILLPPESLNKNDLSRRFKREVIYQSKCIHTNIASIILHNLNVEAPWFIMQLAESDLSHDISRGHLTISEKISIFRSILSGVKYIHKSIAGEAHRKSAYLHRDLKPSNILRFKDNTYKISDFGLVKNADEGNPESEILTKVATAMGTLKYMAPEVSAADHYSVQSDIFALGVILDELSISEISGIKQIIEKCTAWKPSSRYNSVHEVVIALDGLKKENWHD